MVKMLSVRDVMNILPVGRTTATAIVKEVPHVVIKRKLMVSEAALDDWIRKHSRRPAMTEKPVTQRPTVQRKGVNDLAMLTSDGKIPTRRQMELIQKGVKV